MARGSLVECPHCGATFPKGRLACPECGSDERTGWLDSTEIDYQSVEIPDTYDEFVGQPSRRSRVFVLAAVLALVAIAAFALLR